jgi:hypothetical protein
MGPRDLFHELQIGCVIDVTEFIDRFAADRHF